MGIAAASCIGALIIGVIYWLAFKYFSTFVLCVLPLATGCFLIWLIHHATWQRCRDCQSIVARGKFMALKEIWHSLINLAIIIVTALPIAFSCGYAMLCMYFAPDYYVHGFVLDPLPSVTFYITAGILTFITFVWVIYFVDQCVMPLNTIKKTASRLSDFHIYAP